MRNVIIFLSILILAGIGFGVYWFATHGRVATVVNITSEQNENAAQNANLSAPDVTFVQRIGEGERFVYDTVGEWTVIAPEEVQKSVTEEQRNGYRIIHYATNPDGVALSISMKSSPQPTTMSAIVEGDIAFGIERQPGLSITTREIGEATATLSATFLANSVPYNVSSRYLLLPPSTEAATSWAILEVATPSDRAARYRSILDHLLDSLTVRS
jgi:hypothetical protein